MSNVTARIRRGDAAAVAGIVNQAPRLPGVSRTPAAPPWENAIPFWCLMSFTFVLFIAPQALFPSLELLHLGKLSVGLTAVAYLLIRLMDGRPLTVDAPEVRLVSWFMLLALASIPLSRSPSGSLEFFLSTLVKTVIAFFLIANLLDTMGRLKLLIAFIVLSGLIYSATVLYNFAMGHMFRNTDRVLGYPSPLAGHPDDLGLILNVILSLAVGLYLPTRRRLVKMLFAGGIALMAAGVILTFSRGAFLALMVTLAVFLAKLVRARGPLVLLPVPALVVLGMLLAPAGYADRLYSLVDPTLDRVGSISQRWQEIQVASAFILENPLIGAGLGMDAQAFVERGLGYGWSTHNAFLVVGVDLGLPGMLIYGLLAVQVLRGLRQTQRRLAPVWQAREVGAIATGLEMAVYGYLVAAFFLPDTYDFTFFYLAGMAVAIRVIGARLTVSPSRTR